MTTSFDRRRFLQLAGLATGTVVAGAGLAGCRSGTPGSGATGAGEALRINSFGGTFQEAIQEVVVSEFKARHKAQVSIATAISTEALTQLRSSPKGNPAFDVAYMDLAPIYQAKAAGLLQKIDPSKAPSIGELYPLAVDKDGFWVAELVSMTGIAYNTEKVTTPPTSWKDLWKPEFKGKVAVSDVAGTAGYQFLAQTARLNGGSEADIDPGFERLQQLKPNLAAIYKTPDEMSRLLTSGEAWLGVWYADRLSSLKRKGAPVSFAAPAEGAIAVLSCMCIPAGTTRLDLAHKYIDTQLSADVNKKFITTIAEGPTNSKVTLDDAFLDDNFIPYGQEAIAKLVSLDNETIAKNLAGWVSRWESEIAN